MLPSATYHPYHYKEGAAASNNTELTHYRAEDVPWKGILVEYFEALSAHTFSGLDEPTFHLTWTSVASREAPAYSSSAWAATVNDVALGIADVGLSLFWMTADRLEMTSFTSNLLTDTFYLFVPKASTMTPASLAAVCSSRVPSLVHIHAMACLQAKEEGKNVTPKPHLPTPRTPKTPTQRN